LNLIHQRLPPFSSPRAVASLRPFFPYDSTVGLFLSWHYRDSPRWFEIIRVQVLTTARQLTRFSTGLSASRRTFFFCPINTLFFPMLTPPPKRLSLSTFWCFRKGLWKSFFTSLYLPQPFLLFNFPFARKCTTLTAPCYGILQRSPLWLGSSAHSAPSPGLGLYPVLSIDFCVLFSVNPSNNVKRRPSLRSGSCTRFLILCAPLAFESFQAALPC